MELKLTIRFLLFSMFVLLHSSVSFAGIGNNDSIPPIKFQYKSLIIPGVLLGYGIIGIESDGLKIWNLEVQEEVYEHIDEHVSIDDFSQYFSIVSTFSLDRAGLTAAHNYKDRAIILATSYIIMGGSVNALKYSINTLRPDGSTFNSFPSGHTATAFMGAEMVWQEYKDSSIWPGVIGYTVALSTGMYRIYNDRHWVTDVAAGAGIGILSTKIAYWVNPFLSKILTKKNKKNQDVALAFVPLISKRQNGLGVFVRF
jgi:hypothetical protein